MPIISGSGGGSGLGAVILSGTPSAGQVIKATGATAASWASPDYVLLSSTTLGGDGTFDVSGISGAFSDLAVVLIARGTAAALTDNLLVRFNNDSGGNYYNELSTITGATSISGTEVLAATAARVTDSMPAGTAATGTFAMLKMELLGYSIPSGSTVFRTWSGVDHAPTSTTTGTIHTGVTGGWWNSTSPITRIQAFGAATATLKAASELRIYGRA